MFLGVVALLGWRFPRTGGLEMLRIMEKPPDEHAHHAHHDHSAHHGGGELISGDATPHHPGH